MSKKESSKEFTTQYINSVFRLIGLAIISIFLSVIITGILGYSSTKKSLINKAKSEDLIFIVKSMGARIESRINRALETSNIFARDPINLQWVEGEEKDEILGKMVLGKLENIANSYDYSNLFIAGVKTKHYYFSENADWRTGAGNNVILSESNPADKWFFERLKMKKEVTLNVDYNTNYDKAIDDCFLFINTLMGNVDTPVGICGVGLSLNDISREFKEFKVGEKSSLWMIDENGIIQLSDTREEVGKSYEELLTKDTIAQIHKSFGEETQDIKVSEYVDTNNATIDYAYYKLKSSDWILLYRTPRSENLSLLDTLKNNMMITVGVVLICVMIMFYVVSKKIADPYKQAVLLNKELEDKVHIRTQELKESNDKIMDSIHYAKRLQESILPTQQEIEKVFKDSFLVWKPRDIVGGDFYWFRQIEDIVVLVVGDCTGHGVPGALMTMTVNAILHNIVTNIESCEPSFILKELHNQLKKSLNKNSNSNSVDDGLDIAILCIQNNSEILFAGANLELWVKNARDLKCYKPQCKGVGYNYIELKENIESSIIVINPEDTFVITTDGFIHQNGGTKNYPLGKKRLIDTIKESDNNDLNLTKLKIQEVLETYMGKEPQRDDITVFGFKVK